MIECDMQAIRIGNSIGFTVPMEIVKKANIKAGRKTKILFVGNAGDRTFDELFGTLKSRFTVEELNRMTNEGEDLG